MNLNYVDNLFVQVLRLHKKLLLKYSRYIYKNNNSYKLNLFLKNTQPNHY